MADKKISQLTSATLPLAGTEILPMVQGGATVKALQADLFQWPTGRVTYVPIGGNIQAAVTAATAGDTLILGAGSYPITATITVDKAILIKGQGLSATKVTTATPNLAVFTLTASTARVTDLYIGNTGTGTSYAIYAGDGLTQLQISNVIAVLGGNGLKYGVWSQSSVTVSNSEMYITSADQNSNGVVIYNDNAATVNISANVQNVRVLATGATLNNRGVVFNNNNTAKTITGNVTNCNLTAYASSGATDIALYVQSTTTFNSTVNAYDSVLSGADSDVTVTGTNVLTLFNCTLVNGTTTGTIAYGGTQVSSKLTASTTLNVGSGKLVTDTAGNVGVGVTPSVWYSSYKAIDLGVAGAVSFYNVNDGVDLSSNAYAYAAGGWKYKDTYGASRYNQTNGIHKWFSAPSGTAGDVITFTQVLAVEKDKSLALQGATSQTGAGITFPATVSASTDVNTLDDYDEYTAASAACTGAITTAAVWKLTKVGNVVTLTLPAVIGTASANYYFTFGTVIPVKYRPSALVRWLIAAIRDNNILQNTSGSIAVDSGDGTIYVQRDHAGTNFAAAANTGLNTPVAVSWTI